MCVENKEIMEQQHINERPRWITIKVPQILIPIKVPKKLNQLIFQMNIRGYKTGDIRWGAPIEIDLLSHQEFIDNLDKHKRTNKKEIREFYRYLTKDIDFKLRVHPYQSKKHEPVLLTLILKHSQVKKFEKMFFKAFIQRHKDREN